MKSAEERRIGCYGCTHLRWDGGFDEDYYDEGYFFCDGRIDEPEEKFKKFPCERRLKCFFPTDPSTEEKEE